MKAISLWQPWASAIAVGAKRIETRSWSTSYRGPLAIHAAKRCRKAEMIEYHSSWTWCAALTPLGVRMGQKEALWTILPFGAIVAVCELVDCRPTGSFTNDELDTPRVPDGSAGPGVWNSWTERQMGDFSLGRFSWVLGSIRRLSAPIPYRGSQGFFDVADALLVGT